MKRLLVVLALVAGCGNSPEAAPDSVSAALSAVDREVAARDYAGARTAIEALVRRTTAARDTGALDDDRADRILAAAARLAAALPAPAPPSPSPSPAPKPDTDDDEDDEKRDGEKKGKGKKKD